MSTRGVVHRVYQHRDGTSQRRRGCILLSMLVRPSARARTRLAYKTCLRTPQREDAVPKSPEARRQFTRTEPSRAGVRGAMRRRAWRSAQNERQRMRCTDAPTRQHGRESSSPERSPRRDRHRARDRRSAAVGRAGLSFPLRVSLPALNPNYLSHQILVYFSMSA